eukprot:670610-Alexandrium_andersonii.AAC.1
MGAAPLRAPSRRPPGPRASATMASEAARWRVKPILPTRRRCCPPPARCTAEGSRPAARTTETTTLPAGITRQTSKCAMVVKSGCIGTS